jgi:hypothetical protein
MRARIDSPFATPEETAKVLGVSRRRLAQLVKLVDSIRPKVKNGGIRLKTAANGKLRKITFKAMREQKLRFLNGAQKTGPLKHKTLKKVYSSRKRRARAKVPKAFR